MLSADTHQFAWFGGDLRISGLGPQFDGGPSEWLLNPLATYPLTEIEVSGLIVRRSSCLLLVWLIMIGGEQPGRALGVNTLTCKQRL